MQPLFGFLDRLTYAKGRAPALAGLLTASRTKEVNGKFTVELSAPIGIEGMITLLANANGKVPVYQDVDGLFVDVAYALRILRVSFVARLSFSEIIRSSGMAPFSPLSALVNLQAAAVGIEPFKYLNGSFALKMIFTQVSFVCAPNAPRPKCTETGCETTEHIGTSSEKNSKHIQLSSPALDIPLFE
ncbi:hypothetical protein OIDMADRAFT_58270 [Oidiodendron maius Zn]|uniref:Uncharacterized protein n=1 Tax=Oidiodendron maius (strain Zn) TaxID=913774 RepID=A0A0C3GZY2_OIDMZ|nr:hypothetical protein OIDMADRAFT_58270 [Oidiodendron maius Zn]